MATYEYRCPRHGDFEVRFPLGEAAPSAACGHCRGEAVRVFSAPSLTVTPRLLATAIDRAGRSAEAPEVVSHVPPRRAGWAGHPKRAGRRERRGLPLANGGGHA